MRSLRLFFLLLLAAVWLSAALSLVAQTLPAVPPTQADLSPGMATLKVCLRLPDESPFLGVAAVRVMPTAGNELLGIQGDSPGEFLFSGVTSGIYDVFVSAPGYQPISLSTQIESGPRLKNLFVPMSPKSAPQQTILVAKAETPEPVATPETSGGPHASATAVSEPASFVADSTPAAGPAGPNYWSPHELEETVPPVDPGIACPTDKLVQGVGQRMTEFVTTLEKFTATEKLDHYTIDRTGNRKNHESRTFAYVVSVKQNPWGTILLDEFRNGTTDADLFPAHTASRGSPAMALIFHPNLSGGFDFRCEGMGQLQGREAWQMHFVQKPDKPIQIRSYSVDGRSYGVALEGRVWIDPGTDQVLRLETELVKPVPEIELTREHFAIDYQPVEFHSTSQKVWLPQVAELYVERRGRRFYRRHTYSEFMLFNVDAAQNIRTPGESFSFVNSTPRDISGELTVSLRDGLSGDPVILHFTVPAHGTIYKIVGPGKDIDLPPTAVGSATFVHDGDVDAIKVDTHLTRGASLDVVAHSPAQPKP